MAKEKYPDKTIWLYTGDSWENILYYPMMQYVDVVVDGEFHIEELDLTSGCLKVNGKITALVYVNDGVKKSTFRRLFS